MSAQRKAKAAQAAEFKQKARKLAYGHCTSDDLAGRRRSPTSCCSRSTSILTSRCTASSSPRRVPIPNGARCGELRDPCACGSMDIRRRLAQEVLISPTNLRHVFFYGTIRPARTASSATAFASIARLSTSRRRTWKKYKGLEKS